MPTESDKIELSEHELREIAGYAARCARRTLPLFEQSLPADPRPREAVEAAEAFAGGGRRTGALRQSAWAAYRAAQDAAAPPSAAAPAQAASPAAADAARAASHAAAAAYLHPLANAHQVKHVLGAAAHAARAEELAAGDSPAGEARSGAVGEDRAAGRNTTAGAGTLDWACRHAPAAVAAVLGRLPTAPPGGGRVGELIRDLDAALRA